MTVDRHVVAYMEVRKCLISTNAQTSTQAAIGSRIKRMDVNLTDPMSRHQGFGY